jgi:hypothetical protein
MDLAPEAQPLEVPCTAKTKRGGLPIDLVSAVMQIVPLIYPPHRHNRSAYIRSSPLNRPSGSSPAALDLDLDLDLAFDLPAPSAG